MNLKTRRLVLMMLIIISTKTSITLANTPIVTVQGQQKTLVVGSEQNFPPFATGMTDSTADGFTVDFWKAVATEAGLKYTIRVLPFRQVLQEFKEGEIDVLINLAISDERSQFADFSVPHVIVHGAIFVRENKTSIQSENDLSDQTIIVLDADLAHDYAIAKGWAEQLILVDTVAEGLKLLASGKHDAMLLSKLVGMQSLKLLGLTNIKPLNTPAGFSQKFAFAVPQGQADLLSQINEAMAITNSNGIYTTLYNKWFGVYSERKLTLRELSKYFIPLIALFLVIFGYFYHRRQVERKQAISVLQKSEERWQFALEGSGDGVWDWDVVNSTVWFSKQFKKIIGYAEHEIGTGLDERSSRIHPNDMPRVMVDLHAHLDGQTKTYISEHRMRCKDGSYKWILDRGMVIKRDAAGKALRLVGVHTDITDRKLAENKLKLSATVFSHAREGIMITDATSSIVDVNNTYTEITGYSREELIGQTPNMFKSDKQSPEFFEKMWQTVNTKGYWKGEIWNQRKNGEVFAELKTISAVHDEHGVTTHYVALGNDITLIKNHQQQLEHIAHYDLLTSLPNRTLLADRLSQAMLQCGRKVQSLAVVFLDLDHFKEINDTHGHDVGDELLIAISQRMKRVLREGDTLARFGGDEFVAVLVGLTKAEDYEPVLERFLLAASEPIIVGDDTLKISASIGVTLYPQDNADADQLVRHADQAMYVAKESGKNRYHLFDTAHDNAVKAQRESLTAIRRALDNRQFVLYYQPKVNMKTGTIIGVEALIRWQHPKRGLLNPIAFLPVIEDHEMMTEMGEWVIDTALTQISQWQGLALNLPLNISVNIAAIQLQESDFADKLATLLAAHPDVEPHHLELEVLETSAINNMQRVSEIMNACIKLGVSFSLDDFGTGFSSLTQLRRLPANLIKIDQSFVRDMLIDTDDFAIVEGVVALTKSFKLDVIAEGVESIEHGTALLKLGCELAQGYGIARPMPAADIPLWVNYWKPDNAWKA
ncbi:MAG: diguanylate cyclase (GGDEF)-like protein/PAS domain S-box-containing protein [Cellvibrionaceae bacterium]|jgi:diguanylate cyclase (GGDEF)-like protein/PAS domain S-box-containing protein